MAYSPSVFVKWKYTDDRSNELVYKILAHLTTQLDGSSNPKIGGEAADGTEQRPASSFRPRCILLYNAANKLARRVIAFDHTAPLYTGAIASPGNTLQLYAGRPSELLTFTCYGYEGERMRGERA